MKGWRRLVPESFVTVRFTEREERASLQSPREVSILAPPGIEQLWREEIDQKVCMESRRDEGLTACDRIENEERPWFMTLS